MYGQIKTRAIDYLRPSDVQAVQILLQDGWTNALRIHFQGRQLVRFQEEETSDYTRSSIAPQHSPFQAATRTRSPEALT